MSQDNLDPYAEAERLRNESNLSPAGTPMQADPANTVSAGKKTMGCGCAFALFPLPLAALVTAPGSNMWSESDPNSGGSGLWALLVTLPIGLVIGLIGLAMYVSGSSKLAKKRNQQ